MAFTHMDVVYARGTFWTVACPVVTAGATAMIRRLDTDTLHAIVPLPGSGLYVRLAVGPTRIVGCAQDGTSDALIVWNDTGDVVSLGPCYGTQQIAIEPVGDAFRIAVVRSTTGAAMLIISGDLDVLSETPIPFTGDLADLAGTSQGIRDLQDGEIAWVDRERSIIRDGLIWTLWMAREGVLGGQLSGREGVDGVGVRVTGEPRYAPIRTPLPPRLAVSPDGDVRLALSVEGGRLLDATGLGPVPAPPPEPPEPPPPPPPPPPPDPVPPEPPMPNPVSYDQFLREASEVADRYRLVHGRDPSPTDLYHNAWRRLSDERWSHRDILRDIGTGPDPIDPPAPVPAVSWPALGASYYTAATDPGVDLDGYARFLADCGVEWTAAWLLDAWAIGRGVPVWQNGQLALHPGVPYDGFVPWLKFPGGRYHLFQWNAAYFDRIRTFTETMNRRGLFVVWTLLELYSWAERKDRLPFVPDQHAQPLRNNRQNIVWGHPDDPTLFALPDVHPFNEFLERVLTALSGTVYAIKIGNEFPEKDLHFRTADRLRALGYTGDLIVNRQEDSPGQPFNMDVGGKLDCYEFHGQLQLSDFDTVYPGEIPAGRPETHRKLIEGGSIDPARLIYSSDGGGGNPALQPELREVARYVLGKGCSYEHQLALKRNRFFGDGSLRMADLELDRAFLESLR